MEYYTKGISEDNSVGPDRLLDQYTNPVLEGSLWTVL